MSAFDPIRTSARSNISCFTVLKAYHAGLPGVVALDRDHA